MIPWERLDRVQVPGNGGEMVLYRRGKEYSIRLGHYELMNSRVYGSEDALADLACAKLGPRPGTRILVGGLGMGYTVASALRHLEDDGRIVVAELVPDVVKWNCGVLSELAGRPLEDERVTVRIGDVAVVIREQGGAYDAILLDVDNGPAGLTRKDNNWIYSEDGLAAAYAALKPAGVLAVWSTGPERIFTRRLNRVGFIVSEVRVRSRGAQGGSQHVIWLAQVKR